MSEIPGDVVAMVDALMDEALANDHDVSTEEMMARAIRTERKRCAEIARTTYAKDAFHYELGTAVAERIESGQ